ncbi:UDP-N-acetylglucosamine 2-epimerase (hydrolyzing) [Prochlorococcus marinus XMU1411]|uniref:UDP-N-acetylglucosamine 2-epimerase n=1 Tax=Prochlorococcus marinus TaxID=1219 RepID=UPI001ADC0158|nr:UDP-N-acetylglucosamine 2-epimerase [Prochlorococcus marinus]MBO8244214.1 UDP-N-acetylglucosamine 2-epimerase (hydrolyzing) [Prochlorococcus marinus XMU1411]MBW3055299.1 UDP-N-acetylglucosamine 2-epimerase (hydrolyzing) [Prochlorococcus marinus str. MU1411]MCR8537042.1 UDP-N-acetylglucosamine 2-epimerase [Prochlorococcus marinus CUG1430]
MKKICIVIGSRANYSSIKSAMEAIDNHPGLDLKIVATASALLERYGSVIDLIEKDGFHIEEKIYMLLEGETPSLMAKSTGIGLIELTSVFERINPDIVITVGDRFETMSTAIAASYMNIIVAHTMGGEVSGTIDESIRHAVTKLSHLHFPASDDAYRRIIKLGEPSHLVFNVGCPRIDLVAKILNNQEQINLEKLLNLGVGDKIDFSKPFILVSQHPVTTEYGEGKDQIEATLKAIKRLDMQAIILWPNADAGSDDIAKGIRKWRERGFDSKMHFFKNLPVDTYIKLMQMTSCLVGNSSSGIREGAFIGTPVVNIGSRQSNRERGKNVLDVKSNVDDIFNGIKKQIQKGKYEMEDIYGNGTAGEQMARILYELKEINIQKCITY